MTYADAFAALPQISLFSDKSGGKLFSKSLTDKITIADCALFMPNYDQYIENFGEDVLAQAVKDFPLYYICKSEEVLADAAVHYCISYPLRYEKPHLSSITEYKGCWQRNVSKLCYTFVTPEHCGVFESQILKNCLLLRFPYLNTLNPSLISAYHLDACKEFYIKTQQGTLYVPFEALKQNNFEIITDRMQSYFSRFYNDPEKEPFRKKALSALNDPVAIWLKTVLSLLRENASKSL